MSYFIVDCEADGPCPGKGVLTEFGVVDFNAYFQPPSRWSAFHGILSGHAYAKRAAIWELDGPPPEWYAVSNGLPEVIFEQLYAWLKISSVGQPVFVSDNPAFDWQWINHGFWHALDRNPFGHSARRISDFYAGLVGDFRKTQNWKRLRVTPHDHNPVHDAMGNAEALARLLRGER